MNSCRGLVSEDYAAPDVDDGGDEWVLDRIAARRVPEGKPPCMWRYRCFWVGWEAPTWEPRARLAEMGLARRIDEADRRFGAVAAERERLLQIHRSEKRLIQTALKPPPKAARRRCRRLEPHQRSVEVDIMGGRYCGSVDGLDRPHGQGILRLITGQTYTGEWASGLMHGRGRYTWPDGRSYVGCLAMDCFSGQGQYSFGDGSWFRGQFKNDMIDGDGVYRDEHGEEKRVRWKGVWPMEAVFLATPAFTQTTTRNLDLDRLPYQSIVGSALVPPGWAPQGLDRRPDATPQQPVDAHDAGAKVPPLPASCSGGGGALPPVCDFAGAPPPGRECVVCLAEERSHAVVPCGHRALCFLCAEAGSLKLCPVCRGPIERVLEIREETEAPDGDGDDDAGETPAAGTAVPDVMPVSSSEEPGTEGGLMAAGTEGTGEGPTQEDGLRPRVVLECSVCEDAAATHAAVPCGHLAICGACAATGGLSQCPVCQEPLKQIMEIFT